MLEFFKVAHKFLKILQKMNLGALLEQNRTTKLFKFNRLITFILTYYIIFLKSFTIITPPSGTNLIIGTWLELENCKISNSEHFMSFRFRETFAKLRSFLYLKAHSQV